MVKAIAVSSDTFFYGLGLELGLDKMNQTLKAYGFGHKTGIDIVGEKKGLVALSLIHISEPTRLRRISYAVFCLKKKSLFMAKIFSSALILNYKKKL